MGRRKGRAPVWMQLLMVWVVASGLLATGLMFLHARGVLPDAVFATLTPLVCGSGARLELSYGSRDERVDDRGRSDPSSGRSLTYAALDGAACIAADGARTEVKGRVTATMLGLGGLAGAGLVGALFLSMRR